MLASAEDEQTGEYDATA